MTCKLSAWLVACLAGSSVAVASTYTIKNGDTVSGIAHRLHIGQKALLEANGLRDDSALQIGHKLIVPSSVAAQHASKKVKAQGGHVVRNGENDWTIANRLGVSLKALHQANPKVNWNAIQIGQHIAIPSGAASPASHKSSHVAEKSVGGGHYTVRKDDNDWTIAAKLGIKSGVLHRLNPHVNWNAIQPGQKLDVPAGVAARKIHRISTRYALINSDNVTLRRGPGTDEDKVTTVDEGTRARVLDRESGWYKLRFPKGTVAWVRGDFLNPSHSAGSSARHRTYASRYSRHSHRRHGNSGIAYSAADIGNDSVMKSAVAMIDTPYSYGSSSRHATDCSGFTHQVYGRNGVRLPRTAHEQAEVGKRVGRASLKRGDLVFFKTMRSSRINHVGIYMGNGKFIHASSGGGKVQVNSLSDGYYARRFAGARRVATSSPAKKSKKG